MHPGRDQTEIHVHVKIPKYNLNLIINMVVDIFNDYHDYYELKFSSWYALNLCCLKSFYEIENRVYWVHHLTEMALYIVTLHV